MSVRNLFSEYANPDLWRAFNGYRFEMELLLPRILKELDVVERTFHVSQYELTDAQVWSMASLPPPIFVAPGDISV